MKKLLLLATLALAAGCHTEADIRPASYDELAMATGHWEWDRSTAGLFYDKTPASAGYSRQLVFGPDHHLTLRRSGKPDYQTDYQLSIYTVASSVGSAVSHPAITFDTQEADLPTNSLKYYSISQQNGQQVLVLTGEKASRDAGAYETYHWVAN